MADVIAAPQHHVVADRREWLNGVVFEYETVVADYSARKHGRLGADVADHLIALLLRLVVNRLTQLIHAAGRHRREKLERRGRMCFLNVLERDDGQSFKSLLFRQVALVNTEEK